MSKVIYLPLSQNIVQNAIKFYIDLLFGGLVELRGIVSQEASLIRDDPSEHAWEISCKVILDTPATLLSLISACQRVLASTVKSGVFVNPNDNLFIRGLAEDLVTQAFRLDPNGPHRVQLNILVTQGRTGEYCLVFFGNKLPVPTLELTKCLTTA